MRPSPEPLEIVWPIPLWAFAALTVGVIAGLLGGLEAVFAAILLVLAQDAPEAAPVLIAFIVAGVGVVALRASSLLALRPWRVRIDRDGVRSGRFVRWRRPRASIQGVRVEGAWGSPIRITLHDGMALCEEPAAVQSIRGHDPDVLRHRARDIADLLGVPLVDELAPTEAFAERRLLDVTARQAFHRAAQVRNEATHPGLHAAPAGEPRTSWGDEELRVRLHGLEGEVCITPDRVTSPSHGAATWQIDDVHLRFAAVLTGVVGQLLIEVDGRCAPLLEVPVPTPEHAGHLRWTADRIRTTADQARRARQGRAGDVPESIRRLRADPRTQERPPE